MYTYILSIQQRGSRLPHGSLELPLQSMPRSALGGSQAQHTHSIRCWTCRWSKNSVHESLFEAVLDWIWQRTDDQSSEDPGSYQLWCLQRPRCYANRKILYRPIALAQQLSPERCCHCDSVPRSVQEALKLPLGQRYLSEALLRSWANSRAFARIVDRLVQARIYLFPNAKRR